MAKNEEAEGDLVVLLLVFVIGVAIFLFWQIRIDNRKLYEKQAQLELMTADQDVLITALEWDGLVPPDKLDLSAVSVEIDTWSDPEESPVPVLLQLYYVLLRHSGATVAFEHEQRLTGPLANSSPYGIERGNYGHFYCLRVDTSSLGGGYTLRFESGSGVEVKTVPLVHHEGHLALARQMLQALAAYDGNLITQARRRERAVRLFARYSRTELDAAMMTVQLWAPYGQGSPTVVTGRYVTNDEELVTLMTSAGRLDIPLVNVREVTLRAVANP